MAQSMIDNVTSPKIFFTFNKFFYDLIKDLKNVAPELKSTIKKNYVVRNKETDSHFNLFAENATDDVIKCLANSPSDKIFTFEQVNKLLLIIDTDLSDVILHITSDFQEALLGYIYVFALLVAVHRHPDNEVLFMAVMHAVSAIQKNEPYDSLIEDIIDDDIRGLLLKLSTNTAFSVKTNANTNDGSLPRLDSAIENSTIGSIAKEIAESIDLSSMNLNDPSDLLSAKNGGIIGDLVSKVSSKLQQKFENGSVNQNDLAKEAMSMMSMFGGQNGGGGGGGDMIANIIKAMAANGMGGMPGMGAAAAAAAAATPANDSSHEGGKVKERLKKKLESRQAKLE